MRRLLATLAAVLPLAAAPQEPSAPAGAPADHAGPAGSPTGLTVTVSLGGGGELGLESGKSGVLELEGAVGYEFPGGIRPELAAALGVAPDSNVALRPGVRVGVPSLPIQVRVALDASTSRKATGLDWRWFLVGVAGEVRLTSLLGLYGEIDTGAGLSSKAGLPLLIRGGASFRF
jgi:hypothetical protein